MCKRGTCDRRCQLYNNPLLLELIQSQELTHYLEKESFLEDCVPMTHSPPKGPHSNATALTTKFQHEF